MGVVKFIIWLSIFASVLARHAKVERLEVNGVYRSPNCNVNVTCHVRTYDHFTEIRWSLYGGPPAITDIARVPGFTVRPVASSPYGLRQTISINQCYSKLELKCKADDSKKSVKLYSGISLRIPLRTIIGIIFGVLSIAIAVGALIMLKRRRSAAKARTAGLVTLNPPASSYPSQTTALYPQEQGFAYPQQDVSSYPPQPGVAYPPPSGTAYPAPPGTAYPTAPPVVSGYPQYPMATYPSQATPYPPFPPTANTQPLPPQDPPPSYQGQQPAPPGFK